MDRLDPGQENVVRKVLPTDILSAVLLFLATALVTIQVIMRTFFVGSAPWTEELGRYLFVWAVYLGAIAAVIRGTHIRVTFLVERFGERGEWWSLLIGRVAGILTCTPVAWYGWQIAWNKRRVSFYSLPDAPQSFLYVSAPFCLTIIVAVLAWQLVGQLRSGGGR